SAMTDQIMAQLKSDGPPRFVFAISMEAHGPYDKSYIEDTAERDAIPVPEGINDDDKLKLRNYIYHMRHADAELGRLADLLKQRERPTLLLFYGDHLPALTDTYAKLGFTSGKDMLAQTVPYIRKLDPFVAQFAAPDATMLARQQGHAEEEAAAGAGQ
ncbi:MAG TPA: sulfatase-like hydrolase/transferase, partial [Luteibacter sp.]|uniref:sulfatase-like hydrolase/transferase n=1 Tax=Luteibacter sp. TaxID=1886636 RepID=UPI002F3F64A6